jgi:nitrate reductase gamma subunit
MNTLDWESLGSGTRLLVNQLHYGALAFMVIAYTIKIRQLLKKPAAAEGTPARGDHGRAIRYAYLTLAMPWEIESQRKHWFRWVEFALFHIAMAVGIGYAFTTPIARQAMGHPAIIYATMAIFGVGALIGLSRLLRRVVRPEMRKISSPDDYFCLVLLTLWMASGVLTAPLWSETYLFAFFALATFFLVYVPFSKISHYVYWPFIRFYVGKHFGHRGVYPKKGTIAQAGK